MPQRITRTSRIMTRSGKPLAHFAAEIRHEFQNPGATHQLRR